LIIGGKVTTLKQFFSVNLQIKNLAQAPFALAAGTATLHIPDGLSLAPTGTPQAAEISTAAVPGEATTEETWVLRGDTPGLYSLSATYASTLEPGDEPIEANVSDGEPLHVWGASGLQLVTRIESGGLKEGAPYDLRIGLKNIANVPYYDVNIDVNAEERKNFIFQPGETFNDSVRELAPGETAYSHTYVVVPDAPSEGNFNPNSSFIEFAGETTAGSAAFEVVPPPPIYAVEAPRDTPNMVHLHWQPVPGAEGYEIFSTASLDTAFGSTPEEVVEDPISGTVITHLPASAQNAYTFASPTAQARFYAVSALIHGQLTLESTVIPALAGEQAPTTPGAPPPSQSGQDNGNAEPTATCLNHVQTLPGGITVQAGCFKQAAAGVYEASGKLRINGVDLEAQGQVVLNTRTSGLSSSAAVIVKLGSAVVYDAPIDWHLGGSVALAVPSGTSFRGLQLAGALTLAFAKGEAHASATAEIKGGTFTVSGQIECKLTLAGGLQLKGLVLELGSDIPFKSLVLKKAALA
jgi:hypothetical protein